ncbi:sensor histidine kinase [Dokdonia sinensis]|uniref:histidine kinase n=1 Tax=Dokdonia sinensis TaxID=2479847 RepID=A0A3M0G6U2_9FLAO|nr:sensor histidine kinase [Dokdonia sinensis]
MLCITSLIAQESGNKRIILIESLGQKANSTTGSERLVWLDSLSNVTKFKKEFNYDSILQVTIAHAIKIDSIDIAAYHTSDRINYHNNWLNKPEIGLAIFEKFHETYKYRISPERAATLFIDGGDSYDFSGQKEEAIKKYDSAIAKASLVKNERLKAIAMTYKGYVLSDLGFFAEASINYQEAAKVFKVLKDTTRIIGLKNSLSILYSQNNFFEEAAGERAEGMALADKAGRYDQLVSFYFNAATDLKKQGKHADQIESLKKGYETSIRTERIQIYEPIFLSGLAVAYAQIDSLKTAKNYLSKLENTSPDYTTGQNEKNYKQALKNIAYAEEDYTNALRFGIQHLELEKEGQSYEEIQDAEEFMATVYESMGAPEKAYGHYKRYATLRDSVSSIQKVKALTYYQTLYETEKRDARIAEQQKDIALLDAKNELQKQWILFGGLGLLSIFGLVILARSRNNARRRSQRQEKFTQELITAQEEERIRVARELHDGVGQKLMLLTRRTKETGDTSMEDLASSTLNELRDVSRGLHPAVLERLGFTKAVEKLINEVDASTTIFFTNEIDNIDDQITSQAALHLYRIVQEVLNNMVKHSEAKAASIQIEKATKEIHAKMSDNGKGFTLDFKKDYGGSLGMKTLQERAKILKSRIEIESKPQGGTSISLIIPI